MILQFNNFQFDSKQLLLSRNGELCKLNEKQLKLLALLLSERDKFHSKEAILNNVWTDRVVTDQVIFQNINKLRSMLGDEAIKTYPKKGYQWNLAVTEVQTTEPTSDSSQHQTHTTFVKPTRRKLSYFVAAMAILILLLSAKLIHQNEAENPQIKDQVYVWEKSSRQLKIHSQQQVLQLIFDAPFYAISQQNIKDGRLLVATKDYSKTTNSILRFNIQGQHRGWEGYIEAESVDNSLEQLKSLLVLVTATEYFTARTEFTAISELTQLTKKYPNNSLLVLQLAQLHLSQHDTKQAIKLIKNQFTNNNTPLTEVLLHIVNSDAMMYHRNFHAAKESASHALSVLRALELPILEANAQIAMSWVHLINKDFLPGMQVLNRAARLARSQDEPLLEARTHFIQAFIASKAGQKEVAFTQLDLAKEILSYHNINEMHAAMALYYEGWINGDKGLPYYQAILDLPYTPQYKDRFYNASRNVIKSLLNQQKYQLAKDTIRPWQRPSFINLTLAKIAFAQGELNQAYGYTHKAYLQGKEDKINSDALDAALLLLANKHSNPKAISEATLVNYIKQHGTARWLTQNANQLTDLVKGISLPME